MPRRVAALGALTVALVVAGSAQAGVSPFTFSDLKPLKGTLSYALDVNLAGQVTGVMTDESGFAPVYRGFFYDPQSGLVDIGDLEGANTFAVGLNDNGVVTGTSQTKTGAVHAFLYTPGVGMRDIGANAFPSDISDAGTLIGRLGSNSNAFFWSEAGGFQDLGPGTARGFDAAGGFYGSEGGVPGRWSASGFVPFTPLPAPFTRGEALDGNIFGQAAGRLTSAGVDTSSVWDGSGFLFPAAPDLTSSTAQSINDAGTIAVHGTDADGNDVPLLFDYPYDRARGSLDGLSDFARLLDFTAIDDVGHVAGAGRTKDGEVHGFVITPSFPQQAYAAESILLQRLAVDDPFRTMVERVRQALDQDVNETSCYELARLRQALGVSSGVPFTAAQRDAARSALAAAARGAECGNGLAIAPTTLPYVFTRKNERAQFSVRLARAHKVRVVVDAPFEANVVTLNVPKKRVKGTVRITIVARKLLDGGPTPVTMRVS